MNQIPFISQSHKFKGEIYVIGIKALDIVNRDLTSQEIIKSINQIT